MQRQHKSRKEIGAALAQLPDAGEFWCIDLATHRVDWKTPVGAAILGTPAVDGDRVYFGSRNGDLYCVATTGRVNHKFAAGGPIVCGPSVSSKYVYVVTTTGTLYALDKLTLALVWRISLESETFSSPTVANGHVYLGTNDRGVLSAGLPGGDDAAAGPK